MKIGIGVTTFNRPEHLELFWKNIEQNLLLKCMNFSPLRGCDGKIISALVAFWGGIDYDIYIADDSEERIGIAKRKNECLRALKDCDYIFLFDDDCFPIKEGWAEFFIEASKASGQHHFMYLKETPTIKCIGSKGYQELYNNIEVCNIEIYNNCAGCFIFLTKEVIKKVGGYGEYGIYGFEHAGYSQRINMAGLTPLGAYACPVGAGEYIYSMDLDNHLPFNKQVNHEPSLKNELGKIREYVSEGMKCYEKDLQQIYKPL